jgi:cardiolipin synthase
MADQAASTVEHSAQSIRATIAGTHLDVLLTGSARLQAILDLIHGATKTVRLLFYIFNTDRSGRQVRDALVHAAARGVKVRILLDGFGSGNVEPEFFSELERQGGDFCLFHPKYGRRYLVRNHQKLVVADERRAIIGGANIHDEYLTDEGTNHWRDLWMLVEGDAVPAAATYFDGIYGWTTEKGAKLRKLRKLVHRHSQCRGPLQWKFTSPMSRRNPWPSSVARDMAQSRSLEIIAAYFSPPRSVLRRIGRLAGRGKVRIITASKSDNRATIDAARHTYQRLLRRGVEMYEYQPARLHSKLLIAGDAVHFGSANFDFRSIYLNLEIMLRIDDAGFAGQMRRYFEGEVAVSEQITPQVHRQRANLWNRIKWTVSHWLVTTIDYTVTRRLNFGPER